MPKKDMMQPYESEHNIIRRTRQQSGSPPHKKPREVAKADVLALAKQLQESINRKQTEIAQAQPTTEIKQRKLKNNGDGADVKRQFKLVWWKLIVGSPLAILGIVSVITYLNDPQNMVAAMGAAVCLGGGGYLIYQSFNTSASGFIFGTGRKKYTGRENTIVWFAYKNGNGKDIPLSLNLIELKNPPKLARLHYVRNWSKHYYELYNNTALRKLKACQLPDKKPWLPSDFSNNATMNQVKEYLEYVPPSKAQQVAPWILIAAMVVVGILMVMTTG